MTTTIICLGHAALDRIYRIGAFPPSPQKVLAQGFEEVGGGMAANAAVAAARLGGRVAFYSRIGDDLAGEAIRQGLQDEGIDTAGLRVFAGGRSSTSAVIVDGAGERLLVSDRGAGLEHGVAGVDFAPVVTARVVLADVRWPAGAAGLFTAARAAGVTTVLDADIGAGDALPGLLALADFALFSAPGLQEFAPGDIASGLARAAALGPRHVGVTQGARGYTWRDGDGLHHLPAREVAAVDTSGAGDAFHGGFTWALAEGMAVRRCIEVGQAVAALKCRAPGNRAGLPSRAALEAFLAV